MPQMEHSYLQTSPELFKKLLLGDDLSSARSTSPSQKHAVRAVHSAGGAGPSRTISSRAPGQLGTFDTPRGFSEEALTIDQELSIELESVKRERQSLLESIAQVKAEAGEQAAVGLVRQIVVLRNNRHTKQHLYLPSK